MSALKWHIPTTDNPFDERERAALLLAETNEIEVRQSGWFDLNLWNSMLYTNRELIGFRWGADDNATSELTPKNLRTENLIESIGQAMVSKASSSPLKPTLVPHGNSWKVERAVHTADRFLMGVWMQTQAEDACVQMFNDAYTAGIGCVQIAYDKDGPKGGTVHVESVFFDNIVIDNRECANRASPRTYRIRKVVPVESVEALYDVQFTADEQKPNYPNTRTIGNGFMVVVEAWRLPDAKGKGGYHMVAGGGRILSEEKWRHNWVPLVFLHWGERISGFLTKGGVEQVIPYQLIQNELNDDIRTSQKIACRALMTIQANTLIDVSAWKGEAGTFLMHAGAKPEPLIFPTNLTELYNERERNYAKAFSSMGLSEMFANADMPEQVRLDSSAGVREFRNMEDARHLRLWTKYEDARLQVARGIMNVLSVSKGAEAFTTYYHPGGGKANAKNIPYAAIQTLTEDHFSWRLAATPLAQLSPAVRREVLRDYASRGLVANGTDEQRRMESNPNLERIEDFEMISSEDIDGHLETLEDGDYRPPQQGITNLSLGIMKVTANYQRLMRYEDVDASMPMMQNHLRWLAKASSIVAAAAQPQPQMTPFGPTQGVSGTSSATMAGANG